MAVIAAWLALAACIALYLLREDDNLRAVDTMRKA
jgi:hypothetical protein